MVPTFQINKICPFGRFLEKFSFTEHIKHEIKGFLVFSDSAFGPSARVRHGSGMEEGYFVNMDYVLEVMHTYRIKSLRRIYWTHRCINISQKVLSSRWKDTEARRQRSKVTSGVAGGWERSWCPLLRFPESLFDMRTLFSCWPLFTDPPIAAEFSPGLVSSNSGRVSAVAAGAAMWGPDTTCDHRLPQNLLLVRDWGKCVLVFGFFLSSKKMSFKYLSFFFCIDIHDMTSI